MIGEIQERVSFKMYRTAGESYSLTVYHIFPAFQRFFDVLFYTKYEGMICAKVKCPGMGMLPARIWRDGGENSRNLFIFNKKTVRKRKKEVLLDKKMICVYNT